jgi:hypothetical protein
VLNAAFIDRFATIMRVGHLPPEREVEVILSKAPDFPSELAEGLVNVACGVRHARANDEGLSASRKLQQNAIAFCPGPSAIEALAPGILDLLHPPPDRRGPEARSAG